MAQVINAPAFLPAGPGGRYPNAPTRGLGTLVRRTSDTGLTNLSVSGEPPPTLETGLGSRLRRPRATRTVTTASLDIRDALRRAAGRLPVPAQRVIYGANDHLPFPGRWTYRADGMATRHHSPFLEDTQFGGLYDEMAAHWFPGQAMEARWRLWLFTRYALYAQALPGSYAEFGTYRGACAWMLLSTADLSGRHLHLFDTFTGIPEANLSEPERRAGMAGQFRKTSVGSVAELLSPWDPIPRLWPGNVFETMPAADTGRLAFVHVDLNAAAPTGHVLEHVYHRLVPGAVVLFDDYGCRRYREQRHVIDAFMRDKPEPVIALPTGQALVHRAPSARP
jgi:O-methyltransferase